MSLFFKVDNFTDRVMVSLTTMLVVATVMAAIQAVCYLFDKMNCIFTMFY